MPPIDIDTRRIKETAYAPFVSLVMRLVVGGTFVFASISKFPLQLRLVEIVQSYHLLPAPLAAGYALVLPWVELVIGAYLILGILIKPGAIISILIGLSFLVANVSAIIQGSSIARAVLATFSRLPFRRRSLSISLL
jgi:uncharacterized membrane protein YphA (DoxX/SURF4 family)